MSQIVSSTVEKNGGAFNLSLFQGATLVKVVVGAVIAVAVVASAAAVGIGIGVRAQASPPKPIDDAYVTFKNLPISFNPTVNDFAIERDNVVDPSLIVLESVGTPRFGTVDLKASNKTITYTPPKGFVGLDTFTYKINNGRRSAEGSINVTVSNRAPVAADDSFTVPKNIETTLDVLANDSDLDNDLLEIFFVNSAGERVDSIESVKGFGVAKVSEDKQTVSFKPSPSAVGIDNFFYSITDGNDTSTAQVTLSIRNDPPVAFNKEFTVDLNQEDFTYDILGSTDYDPNNDAISVSSVGKVINGLFRNEDGSYVDSFGALSGRTVTYTPNFNDRSGDAFDYSITDSYVTVDQEAFATVQVKVVDHPPVAEDIYVEFTKGSGPQTIDLSAKISDLNRFTTIEVTCPSSLELGSISCTSTDETKTIVYQGKTTSYVEKTWTAVYTPAPGASYRQTISYTVSDGFNSVTGRIYIRSNNQKPTAGPVSISRPRFSSSAVNTCFEISLASAVNDPDGDNILITRAVPGTLGTATVVTGTLSLLYCAVPGAVGTDTFRYFIKDSQNQPEFDETASNFVTVELTNTAPVCNSARITMNKSDAPLSYSLLNLCSDAQDDRLVVVTFTGSGTATGSLNDNVAVITPTKQSGETVFTFTVTDGGLDATATLTVEVLNQAPDATPVSTTFARRERSSVVLTPEIIEFDGDSTSLVRITSAASDAVVAPDGRSVTFSHMNMTISGSSIVVTAIGAAPATSYSRSATYFVADSDVRNRLESSSTVSATITSRGPTAGDTVVNYNMGQDASVNVASIASDVDGDSFTVAVVERKVVSVTVSGTTLTYRASQNPTFCVEETIRYSVTTIDGTATGTVTFKPTNCRCTDSKVDICFMIDSSGSLSTSEWKKEVDFARSVTDRLAFGTNGVKVGIVRFDDEIVTVTSPALSFDKNYVMGRWNFLYENKWDGYTYTGNAFDRCDRILRGSTARSGVPKVHIHISDGEPNGETIDSTQITNTIKGRGHKIITVGVGMNTSGANRLRSFATDPSYFFDVASFNDLDKFVDAIVGKACFA